MLFRSHSQKYGSITLSRRMKDYAAGLYEFGPQRLYVNKGVGYGWRIRYNRRPEIAVFDLAGRPDASMTEEREESRAAT